jgi:hypothetical protein
MVASGNIRGFSPVRIIYWSLKYSWMSILPHILWNLLTDGGFFVILNLRPLFIPPPPPRNIPSSLLEADSNPRPYCGCKNQDIWKTLMKSSGIRTSIDKWRLLGCYAVWLL